ncbi:MAG: chromate efflux transporter [Gemmataceae bacterium]|nr:chromate efflux transporter [Gemmataceae bacterium]
MEPHADAAPPPKPRLRELALVFLRLGATAFGGPAAHIAMMEEEVVRRRGWMSRAQFLDLLAATNLIPGPNSTEMAIHVGLLAGWRGLLVSGGCFIVPAVVLVTIIAWAYERFGSLPAIGAFLYGVKPVIVAIVAHALIGFAQTSLKSVHLVLIALAAGTLVCFRFGELVILAGAGLTAVLFHHIRNWHTRNGHIRNERPPSAALSLAAPLLIPAVPLAATSATPFGLLPLFLFFAKVGSVLFGSGYVLLAFLRADLVERWGWLTEQQLLDAIFVGQVTPGPVFTTATFIGYVLGGVPGAATATVGIFLPAFVFVALSGPLVPRLRHSPTAGAFLDGLIVASLALMAVVTWNLGQASLGDGFTRTVVVLAALALVLFRRLNSVWLVLAAGVAGLLWTAAA